MHNRNLKKLLIVDAHLPQAISLSKYIKKCGKEFLLVGCTETKNFFKKDYFDMIVYNKYDDINFEEYDYIIPAGAKGTSFVLKRLKQLKFDNGIFFSENNLVCFNKIKMLEFVEELGIKIPRTWQKKEEIDTFPIFYKEKFEKGGGIRGIAFNFNELPDNKDLIYQEFIDSKETYGVGFIAKEGKILTYFVHKEILSFPPEGGSAVAIERIENEVLLNYVKKIVKRLNYNGWGLAEFKYCKKRKDFVFMEINAKWWASLELALRNNPMFLRLLLNISYSAVVTENLLFLDRYIMYDIKNLFLNVRFLKFNITCEQPSLLLALFFSRILLKQVKKIVKKILL